MQTRASRDQRSISLILHWLGIGDIIVCGAILRGLQKQYSDCQVNFYLQANGEVDASRFLPWAQVVWPSSKITDAANITGQVFEIGRPGDPNADPERMGVPGLRHNLWAGLCDTEAIEYQVKPSEAGVAQAREILRGLGVDLDRPIVYFSPVTANEWRNWPIERWMQLEQTLNERSIQVVIGALKPEPWATQEQLSKFSTPYFVGQYHPDVLLGILQGTNCVVSNDSGFAHLGGILLKPTVAICGGNYDGFACYGWYKSVKVLQAASRDINDVSVGEVFAAIDSGIRSTT